MGITREEKLLNSIANGVYSGVEPVTREEQYLAYIAGETYTKPDEPITRKEVFLDKIPQGGGSGGGGVTIRNQNKTITENGTYTADSGYTGLGTVTVEVASSGGGGDLDALIEGTLTEINSGVTKIADNAFYNHKSIKTVSFPNATSIGKSAFNGCSGITSANFPNATSIGDSAFRDCTSFTSLNFPKVTSIANSSAFYNCNALKSIDFSNLTSIGTYAFSACSRLIAVILRSETLCTLPNTNAFDNAYHIIGKVHSHTNPNGDKDGYIYVPRALLSDTDETMDYRRATNWSTYASQFRALEDYTVDGTITGDLDPTKI